MAPSHLGRGESCQILVILQCHGSTAVANRRGAAGADPVQLFEVETAVGFHQIGHRLDIRQGGAKLVDLVGSLISLGAAPV